VTSRIDGSRCSLPSATADSSEVEGRAVVGNVPAVWVAAQGGR
jgi:hypothetical protein